MKNRSQDSKKAVKQAQAKDNDLRKRCPICKARKGDPCVRVAPKDKGGLYPGVHPERKR